MATPPMASDPPPKEPPVKTEAPIVVNSSEEEKDDLNSNSTTISTTTTIKEQKAPVLAKRPPTHHHHQRKNRKCSICAAKTRPGCSNQACKRCCIHLDELCAIHAKPAWREDTFKKTRKRVLKNEYKETQFMYYEETVTIFCVKDFFENAKLSQGVLNDQKRFLRMHGAYMAQSRHKRKRDGLWQQKCRELFQKSPITASQNQQSPVAVSIEQSTN